MTEIHVTADLETGTGMPADGRKIKGTIHWVSASNCDDITVMLYDKLFTVKNPDDIPEDKTYKDYINPESLKVLSDAKAEKGILEENEKSFQFVRCGYFVKDSKNPSVFNRTVSLKDGYRPE